MYYSEKNIFWNSTSDGHPVVCNGNANDDQCQVYEVMLDIIRNA